eukprot:12973716-Alexandrium_andersonii.AAC.1
MLPEIKYRIRMAEVTFKKLHMVWRAPENKMSLKLKLRVYTACVRAKLTYGMGVGWYTSTQLSKLEAYHCRCVRRVLGVRSTYGSKLLGEGPTTNKEVLRMASVSPLGSHIRALQLGYLGHILRKPPQDPLRNMVFDRLLNSRKLGGPRRDGAPRELWADRIMSLALESFRDTEEYQVAYEASWREDVTILGLAQDRTLWKRLVDRKFKNPL